MAERVGGAYIELFTKLKEGFAESVKRDGKRAGDGLAAGFASAGSKLSSAGKNMTKFVTFPLLAVGVEAFAAASKLEKVQGRTERVFGEMSKSVENFAEHAATSLGQSTAEALTATDRFGNMFRSMGIGTPKAVTMSETLDKLAVDLASFNNVPVDRTLKALTSGVAGATRGLKPFGIIIDQTAIKAEALRLGLIKAPIDLRKVQAAQFRVNNALVDYGKAVKDHGRNSDQARRAQQALTLAQQGLAKSMSGGTIPALTAAQKAQASYSLILKQSKLAQGDFARNADNAANRTKILHAQFQNLTENLGTQLLPIGNQLLAWAGNLANKFNTLSPHAQHLIVLFGGIAAAAGPVTFAFGKMFGGIGKLAGGIGKGITGLKALSGNAAAIEKLGKAGKLLEGLGGAAKKIGPAFKTLATTMSEALLPLLGNPVFLAIAGLVALGAAVFIAYKKFKPFHDAVDAVGRALVTFAEWVKRNWVQILEWLLVPFVKLAILVAPYLEHFAGTVVSFLASLPGKAARALGNIGTALLHAGSDLLLGFYRGVLLPAARLYVWWETLPIRILARLAGIGARLVGKGVETVSGFLSGVVSRAVALFAWWGGLERRILGAIGNAGSWLISKGSALISGFLTGEVRAWGRIASWLAGTGGRVVRAIGNLGGALYQVGKDLVTGFLRGIQDMWQHLTGWLGHAVSGIVHSVTSLLGIGSPSRVFRDIGNDTVQGLILGLRDQHRALHATVAQTSRMVDINGNARGTLQMRVPDWQPTPNDGIAAAAGRATSSPLFGDVYLQSIDPDLLIHRFLDEAARKRRSRAFT